MKKLLVLSLLPILAVGLLVAGCGENKTDQAQADAPAAQAQAAAPSTMPADPNSWHGTVVETMDAANYTYVLLDTGSERIWCAGPQTVVKAGDQVSIPKGMLMPNFHSKALERDFAEIYFVGAIRTADSMAAEAMPHDHPDVEAPAGGGTISGAKTVLEDAEVEGVTKAEGGYTVEEIYTRGAELSGRTVKVRGRVVKFSPNIMGTNWVHIQDGTGSGDTVDLTVTTSETVATGELITAEGALTVNKDFGAGYFYKAIIEKAAITRE